ncbi:hypothetical protein R3P38DRAFT_3073938, partial [Favolaschia claudopus]
MRPFLCMKSQKATRLSLPNRRSQLTCIQIPGGMPCKLYWYRNRLRFTQRQGTLIEESSSPKLWQLESFLSLIIFIESLLRLRTIRTPQLTLRSSQKCIEPTSDPVLIDSAPAFWPKRLCIPVRGHCGSFRTSSGPMTCTFMIISRGLELNGSMSKFIERAKAFHSLRTDEAQACATGLGSGHEDKRRGKSRLNPRSSISAGQLDFIWYQSLRSTVYTCAPTQHSTRAASGLGSATRQEQRVKGMNRRFGPVYPCERLRHIWAF